MCHKTEQQGMLIEGLKFFPYEDRSSRITKVCLICSNADSYVNILHELSQYTSSDVTFFELSGELYIV